MCGDGSGARVFLATAVMVIRRGDSRQSDVVTRRAEQPTILKSFGQMKTTRLIDRRAEPISSCLCASGGLCPSLPTF
jgi:hypothetical protein